LENIENPNVEKNMRYIYTMPSSSEKWNISLFSLVIFLIVVNPFTYSLTNSILKPLVGPLVVNGCPTTLGIFIHSIVYLLLVRFSMDLNLNF